MSKSVSTSVDDVCLVARPLPPSPRGPSRCRCSWIHLRSLRPTDRRSLTLATLFERSRLEAGSLRRRSGGARRGLRRCPGGRARRARAPSRTWRTTAGTASVTCWKATMPSSGSCSMRFLSFSRSFSRCWAAFFRRSSTFSVAASATRDGVLEDGADEVRHRDPQVVGEALELALEHRGDARVEHPLLLGVLAVRLAVGARGAVGVVGSRSVSRRDTYDRDVSRVKSARAPGADSDALTGVRTSVATGRRRGVARVKPLHRTTRG